MISVFYRPCGKTYQEQHTAAYELLDAAVSFLGHTMGRIEKTEMQRRKLSENGPNVLRSAIKVLQEERKKESMQDMDLNARLAYLRDKKVKLHKGKAETK